jgi:hypothetical protein
MIRPKGRMLVDNDCMREWAQRARHEEGWERETRARGERRGASGSVGEAGEEDEARRGSERDGGNERKREEEGNERRREAARDDEAVRENGETVRDDGEDEGRGEEWRWRR